MVSSLRTIAKSRAGRGAAFYKKKRCFDSVSSSHRSLALCSGELPALGCSKLGCRPWSLCQTLPCAAKKTNITNHFLNCLFDVVPGVLSLQSCRPRHPRRCLPLVDLALIAMVTISMGFLLVKMLLIMLMIYVWQRCWVSGCLVGCFSKNHIFLHSPLFDNRATAKWPIRYFCATSSTLLRANNCINFETVLSFSFLFSEGEVLCLGQLTTA